MTLTWTPGPLLSWTKRTRLRIFRLARSGLPPLSFRRRIPARSSFFPRRKFSLANSHLSGTTFLKP
ncbi:hypothetical protein OIU74_004958, partial [Salix koriyanagi]